jgi:hypothetical protein
MHCSTSCRKRIRNTAISIITFALALGLIVSSHAQSYRLKADQTEVNMTQTTRYTTERRAGRRQGRNTSVSCEYSEGSARRSSS